MELNLGFQIMLLIMKISAPTFHQSFNHPNSFRSTLNNFISNNNNNNKSRLQPPPQKLLQGNTLNRLYHQQHLKVNHQYTQTITLIVNITMDKGQATKWTLELCLSILTNQISIPLPNSNFLLKMLLSLKSFNLWTWKLSRVKVKTTIMLMLGTMILRWVVEMHSKHSFQRTKEMKTMNDSISS